MIPHGVEVFVGLDPIDLRWGFERLSGVITEKLGRSSRSGAMFVFFGKRRTALKILFFDGGGLCVFYKRLLCAAPHKRRYVEPGVMRRHLGCGLSDG